MSSRLPDPQSIFQLIKHIWIRLNIGVNMYITIWSKDDDFIELKVVDGSVANLKDDILSSQYLSADHLMDSSVPRWTCHCSTKSVRRWQGSSDSSCVADIQSIVVPVVICGVVDKQNHFHLVDPTDPSSMPLLVLLSSLYYLDLARELHLPPRIDFVIFRDTGVRSHLSSIIRHCITFHCFFRSIEYVIISKHSRHGFAFNSTNCKDETILYADLDLCLNHNAYLRKFHWYKRVLLDNQCLQNTLRHQVHMVFLNDI